MSIRNSLVAAGILVILVAVLPPGCRSASGPSAPAGTAGPAAPTGTGDAASRTAGAEPTAEDPKLDRLFDEYLEFLFRMSPTTATALGRHDRDGDLDDLSEAALDERLDGLEAFLSRLPAEINREKLSPAVRADFDILRNAMADEAFSLRELKPFETDPLAYASKISDSVYDLLKRDFAPLDSRARSAISRMKKIPRLVEQARANLKAPPRQNAEVAIRRNKGAIAFYDGEISEFLRGSSRAVEAEVEGKRVAETLRAYGKWLEEDLLPRATGEWRLGRKLWEEKLHYSLNSALTAEEILARARSEFDAVRADMYEVAKGLWPTYFPGQPLPEAGDALQATVKAVLDKIAREHSTRESIVADAKRVVEDLRSFIREKGILALPEPDRCNIIVMPEFQAGVSTAYLDPAPPLEPDGKSFYAIEPMPTSWSAEEVESRLREYNSHMLKILSIHEGYPGHYVQLEYSNRFPSRIRKILGNGPMIEGWAVYTERMMVEAGFAGGDPRLKLSRLKFYLRAVTNALIDQGLHCDGMTDEAALALMMDGAFQEANEAKGKLVRAKVTSTQLSTYFVGYQEVWSTREEVERAEGAAFSLKSFHERFLSYGSPPVRVIREAMMGGK